MAEEIERKFLVSGDGWRAGVEAEIRILQFYLSATDGRSLRIRVSDGRSATLTLKFGGAGRRRDEFEYPVPLRDERNCRPSRSGASSRRHVAMLGTTGISMKSMSSRGRSRDC